MHVSCFTVTPVTYKWHEVIEILPRYVQSESAVVVAWGEHIPMSGEIDVNAHDAKPIGTEHLPRQIVSTQQIHNVLPMYFQFQKGAWCDM